MVVEVLKVNLVRPTGVTDEIWRNSCKFIIVGRWARLARNSWDEKLFLTERKSRKNIKFAREEARREKPANRVVTKRCSWVIRPPTCKHLANRWRISINCRLVWVSRKRAASAELLHNFLWRCNEKVFFLKSIIGGRKKKPHGERAEIFVRAEIANVFLSPPGSCYHWKNENLFRHILSAVTITLGNNLRRQFEAIKNQSNADSDKS